MKKYLLIVVCCVGMVCATDYNPLTDWVDYPGAPEAWSYGMRLETTYGSGVFGDFLPMEHVTSLPSDGWADTTSGGNTCSVWKYVPWNGTDVGMMVWVNHSPVARVTPEAGIYDLTGNFIGIGYTASFPTTYVWIIKNNTDVLWQSTVDDYVTPVPFDLSDIEIQEGDYLEFIVGNEPAGGPEHRASLTADLVAQEVSIAWNPSPEDGDVDIAADTDLCWYGPSDDPNNNTFSYEVYYGYANDLENLSGPFAASGAGGLPHCYTPATELDNETEYAWRVDVLVPDPNFPETPAVRTGDVWTFTTLPAYLPATLVSPTPSGVTGVAYEATLEWANDVNAEWADVLFWYR